MILLGLACDARRCRRAVARQAAPTRSSLTASLLELQGDGWTIDAVAQGHAYCPTHRMQAKTSTDATLLDFLLPLAP